MIHYNIMKDYYNNKTSLFVSFATIVFFCLFSGISLANADAVLANKAMYSETDAKLFYNNATRVTSAGKFGVQISYTAANGQAYLWFPTNSQVVTGKWYIVSKYPRPIGNFITYKKEPHICFNYPNSYNAWNPLKTSDECFTSGYPKRSMEDIEYLKGDKYGLSKSLQVPFVMEKKPIFVKDFQKLWKEKSKR